MKTAISIEDDLFQQAEAAAKELGLSRSALYSQAIGQFIRDRMPNEITRKYDEVFAENGNAEPDLDAVALDVLSRAEW